MSSVSLVACVTIQRNGRMSAAVPISASTPPKAVATAAIRRPAALSTTRCGGSTARPRRGDTGLDLGRRFGERSVHGFDATFSFRNQCLCCGPSVTNRPKNRCWRLTTGQSTPSVVGGGSCSHQSASQRPSRLRRRRRTDRRDVPTAHFPQVGSSASFSCCDRQPGEAPDGRWLALDARTTARSRMGCRHGVSGTQPIGSHRTSKRSYPRST